MPWNTGIDPATPAYGIAADASPAIRVLAGPGTWKSFAIKRRITRLLEEEGLDPTRILAVTFIQGMKLRIFGSSRHKESGLWQVWSFDTEAERVGGSCLGARQANQA